MHADRIEHHRQAIMGAQELDALAAALNAAEDECAAEAMDPNPPRVADNIVDTTELPTYGGDEPDDTRGKYSWDATRLLTCDRGDPDGAWSLVPRAEWGATWYEVCADCGAETAHESEASVPPVPAADADEAWAALATQHGASCDWVLTRAHSR